MNNEVSSPSWGRLLSNTVLAVGLLLILAAALLVNLDALTVTVPVLIVSTWSLLAWRISVRTRYLLPVPEYGSLPLDVKMAVLVHAFDETEDQIIASLSAALGVSSTVILVGESDGHRDLAGRYKIPYLPLPLVGTMLPGMLPDEVDALMPVSAQSCVRPQAVLSAVKRMRELGMSSLSGVENADQVDTYVSAYAASTLTEALVSTRLAGSPVWLDNATIVSRELLTPESLTSVIPSSTAIPAWARLLKVSTGGLVNTTVSTVLADFTPAYDPGSFWEHRLDRLGAEVIQGRTLMRRPGFLFKGLSILLVAMRGWPLMLALLIPAAFAISGVQPSSMNPYLWLLLAAGVPVVAWVVHIMTSRGATSLKSDILSLLYEMPVSLASTRYAFGSRHAPTSMNDRVPLRLLMVVGLASLLSAGLSALLMILNAELVDDVRVVAAVLSLMVAAGVLAAVLKASRMDRAARSSRRKGVSLRATLMYDGRVSPVLMMLTDASIGGARLVGEAPLLLEGMLCELSVTGIPDPVISTVVRVEPSLIALRTDTDPSGHLAWASWVRTGDGSQVSLPPYYTGR